MKVQEVDSQAIFLRESLRLRPRELDDDRRKVAELNAALEAILAQIKRMKMDAAEREVDVKKCDGEIEKMKVALNQAKSNSEYTIYNEQIKKQEDVREKVEDEVLGMFGEMDVFEVKRKDIAARLDAAGTTLQRKEAEVNKLLEGISEQIAALEARRGGLLQGIDPENLKLYERVLARHNNFALARVDGQVCQGCYMSVTSQEIALLRLGNFLQCKCCSRIMYLP